MAYYSCPDSLFSRFCGPRGIRTLDLLNAIETRSQLRYGPSFPVDLEGFEPSTSSVRLKRAPNCATGPSFKVAELYLSAEWLSRRVAYWPLPGMNNLLSEADSGVQQGIQHIRHQVRQGKAEHSHHGHRLD